MAIDGTGLFASDLASDVRAEVKTRWNRGASVEEILESVDAMRRDLRDALDTEIFLVASARALWDIGCLDATRTSELEALLASGESLKAWLEHAGPRDAQKREQVVRKLLADMASPKARPDKRRVEPSKDAALFAEGECLSWTCLSETHYFMCVSYVLRRQSWDCLFLVMTPGIYANAEAFIEGHCFGSVAGREMGQVAGLLGIDAVMPLKRSPKSAPAQIQRLGRVELDRRTFFIGSFGPFDPLKGLQGPFLGSAAPSFPLRRILPRA